VGTSDLDFEQVSDVDAAHHADPSAGQEAELHEPTPEGAIAPELDEAGALAGAEVLERGHGDLDEIESQV